MITPCPNNSRASTLPVAETCDDRWLPIPVNGKVCPISGLGHSTLTRLLDGQAKSHVRSARLIESGRTRGKRLYHVGDLKSYLEAMAQIDGHASGKSIQP